MSNSTIQPRPARPALLAFYLPQFHPTPENDEWWGPGFTEWRNVVRGRSVYANHHQPNLPGELGFYDLRMPEVREAQAALAQAYGITGFCYYHYWFSGRRILEMPFNEVLGSGRPDFPFCLCWANEPWTRNWDGGSRELLISQRYSSQDDRNHIRWLVKAFRDERYIRVGDRPVLFVYNIWALSDPLRTAEIWREECAEAGVGDPYLVQFATFGNDAAPRDTGFDAAAEFLPHNVATNLEALGRSAIRDVRNMNNVIYDYGDLVEGQLAQELPEWTRYQCVLPKWDNTPRKQNGQANLFLGSTPQKYESWLERSIAQASAARHEFVLINAWNEWAEGAYLEPDLRHGRAYREATARAADVDPSHV
ncbi:MAG: glycoside hydrolase family 99-like domain-containing protein, partial [Pseudonocardiaceae bacterium]